MAEVACHVVRIRGSLEVGLMAIVARARQSDVLVVDMALSARNRLMRPSQRKLSRRVTEDGRPPRCGGVARLTVMAEIAQHVVRILRLLEITLMALVAVLKHDLVVAVNVARLTLQRCVGPRQWETCCVMIE
jgi:hypothetical protein